MPLKRSCHLQYQSRRRAGQSASHATVSVRNQTGAGAHLWDWGDGIILACHTEDIGWVATHKCNVIVLLRGSQHTGSLGRYRDIDAQGTVNVNYTMLCGGQRRIRGTGQTSDTASVECTDNSWTWSFGSLVSGKWEVWFKEFILNTENPLTWPLFNFYFDETSLLQSQPQRRR